MATFPLCRNVLLILIIKESENTVVDIIGRPGIFRALEKISFERIRLDELVRKNVTRL